MWVRNWEIEIKIKSKSLKRKSPQKLELNKNRLNILRNNKRIPIRKYVETGDKCNSMIMIKKVD